MPLSESDLTLNLYNIHYIHYIIYIIYNLFSLGEITAIIITHIISSLNITCVSMISRLCWIRNLRNKEAFFFIGII